MIIASRKTKITRTTEGRTRQPVVRVLYYRKVLLLRLLLLLDLVKVDHLLLFECLLLEHHLVDLILLLSFAARHNFALHLSHLLAHLVHVVQLILEVEVLAQDDVILVELVQLLPSTHMLLRIRCLGKASDHSDILLRKTVLR